MKDTAGRTKVLKGKELVYQELKQDYLRPFKLMLFNTKTKWWVNRHSFLSHKSATVHRAKCSAGSVVAEKSLGE